MALLTSYQQTTTRLYKNYSEEQSTNSNSYSWGLYNLDQSVLNYLYPPESYTSSRFNGYGKQYYNSYLDENSNSVEEFIYKQYDKEQSSFQFQTSQIIYIDDSRFINNSFDKYTVYSWNSTNSTSKVPVKSYSLSSNSRTQTAYSTTINQRVLYTVDYFTYVHNSETKSIASTVQTYSEENSVVDSTYTYNVSYQQSNSNGITNSSIAYNRATYDFMALIFSTYTNGSYTTYSYTNKVYYNPVYSSSTVSSAWNFSTNVLKNKFHNFNIVYKSNALVGDLWILDRIETVITENTSFNTSTLDLISPNKVYFADKYDEKLHSYDFMNYNSNNFSTIKSANFALFSGTYTTNSNSTYSYAKTTFTFDAKTIGYSIKNYTVYNQDFITTEICNGNDRNLLLRKTVRFSMPYGTNFNSTIENLEKYSYSTYTSSKLTSLVSSSTETGTAFDFQTLNKFVYSSSTINAITSYYDDATTLKAELPYYGFASSLSTSTLKSTARTSQDYYTSFTDYEKSFISTFLGNLNNAVINSNSITYDFADMTAFQKTITSGSFYIITKSTDYNIETFTSSYYNEEYSTKSLYETDTGSVIQTLSNENYVMNITSNNSYSGTVSINYSVQGSDGYYEKVFSTSKTGRFTYNESQTKQPVKISFSNLGSGNKYNTKADFECNETDALIYSYTDTVLSGVITQTGGTFANSLYINVYDVNSTTENRTSQIYNESITSRDFSPLYVADEYSTNYDWLSNSSRRVEISETGTYTAKVSNESTTEQQPYRNRTITINSFDLTAEKSSWRYTDYQSTGTGVVRSGSTYLTETSITVLFDGTYTKASEFANPFESYIYASTTTYGEWDEEQQKEIATATESTLYSVYGETSYSSKEIYTDDYEGMESTYYTEEKTSIRDYAISSTWLETFIRTSSHYTALQVEDFDYYRTAEQESNSILSSMSGMYYWKSIGDNNNETTTEGILFTTSNNNFGYENGDETTVSVYTSSEFVQSAIYYSTVSQGYSSSYEYITNDETTYTIYEAPWEKDLWSRTVSTSLNADRKESIETAADYIASTSSTAETVNSSSQMLNSKITVSSIIGNMTSSSFSGTTSSFYSIYIGSYVADRYTETESFASSTSYYSTNERTISYTTTITPLVSATTGIYVNKSYLERQFKRFYDFISSKF